MADHDFTQYLNFGDDGSVVNGDALEQAPTIDMTPEQLSNEPDPQLAELAKAYNLPIPAHKSMILDEEKFRQTPDAPMDLSSIPYQQRADYQAEQLMPGESGGIPDLQRDNGSKVQKAAYKNPEVQALLGQLNQLRSADSMPPDASASQAQDPLAARQAEMNAALEDRRNNMNNSVLRGASLDFINANQIARGRKQFEPGYGDQRLDKMQDLKLKDLDTQMKLAGMVGSEEKAKIDLGDMKTMSDPNSPTSQAFRQAASKFLRNDPKMVSMLEGMSAQQIKTFLGDDVAGILAKQADQELRSEQMKNMAEDRAASRAQRAELATDKKDAKEKTRIDTDTNRWATEAMKQPAYKRFQENQESYVFADKLARGEINPNGVDDGALALQAIKLAQADSSVVRESDQKLFAKVGGLEQSAQALQQQILGGGGLTPQVRKAFVDMMIRARSNLKDAAKEQTSHLYQKYKKAGIPDDEIPGTLRMLNDMTEGSKSNKQFGEDVLNYAKTHGITPEQAQSIKEKRSK